MEYAGHIKTEPLEDTGEDLAIIVQQDEKPDIIDFEFEGKKEPLLDLVPEIKVESSDPELYQVQQDEKPDIIALEFEGKKEPLLDLVPEIKVESSAPELYQGSKHKRETPNQIIISDVRTDSLEKWATDKEPVAVTTPTVKRKSKQLNCSVCSAKFNHEFFLLTHGMAHRTWDYRCAICNIRFEQKETFRLHICMHSSGSSVYCPLCDHKFNSGYTLMMHHCVEDTYNCVICRRVYLSLPDVMNHAASHISWSKAYLRYQCSVCKIKLPSIFQLGEHTATHVRNCKLKYVCGMCEKTFVSRCQLVNHMMSHTSLKMILPRE